MINPISVTALLLMSTPLHISVSKEFLTAPLQCTGTNNCLTFILPDQCEPVPYNSRHTNPHCSPSVI